jgi:hypothetical protein
MRTSGSGCCEGKRIEIIKVRPPSLGVNLQKFRPVVCNAMAILGQEDLTPKDSRQWYDCFAKHVATWKEGEDKMGI